MKWYPGACPVCRGDLHDDLDDPGVATCFMCARSFELAVMSRGIRLLSTERAPMVEETGEVAPAPLERSA